MNWIAIEIDRENKSSCKTDALVFTYMESEGSQRFQRFAPDFFDVALLACCAYQEYCSAFEIAHYSILVT
jgi:hypothetical protein